MGRLNGKRALVTAAGQGIGRASALAMAREGAEVIAIDVNENALTELAASGLQTRLLDVRNPASIAEAVEAVGKLNVLFNCAGFVAAGSILDCDEEQWAFSLDLNMTAMYRMCRAFLPAMKAAGGARRIVNIGSLASFLGAPNITAYTASKHAVLGLSDVLAKEHVRHMVGGRSELAAERSPVGITRVCPGIINTPLLAGKTVGTNITQRQLLQQQEYYRTHGCTPDVVADGVVKAVQRGDSYCFVGPKAKLGFWGTRLSRNLAHAMSITESTQSGYLDAP